MDIASLSGISSPYINNYMKNHSEAEQNGSFQGVLSAAMKGLEETNQLQNNAESEEIRFALGEAENTHDLQIAIAKASVALQYTVAVKDGLLDAYKEIMNMQI